MSFAIPSEERQPEFMRVHCLNYWPRCDRRCRGGRFGGEAIDLPHPRWLWRPRGDDRMASRLHWWLVAETWCFHVISWHCIVHGIKSLSHFLVPVALMGCRQVSRGVDLFQNNKATIATCAELIGCDDRLASGPITLASWNVENLRVYELWHPSARHRISEFINRITITWRVGVLASFGEHCFLHDSSSLGEQVEFLDGHGQFVSWFSIGLQNYVKLLAAACICS